MTRWAEVIGDPITHSVSPLIHGFWLKALELEGDYRRRQVGKDQLAAFLKERRADDQWLGCNVTAPLKELILPLLDTVDEAASEVGAVNCVKRSADRLIGSNTDLDGIAEALADARIEGARVALIGAGGAAKAALLYVAKKGAAEVNILARSPDRMAALQDLAGTRCRLSFTPLQDSRGFDGANLIINASPAGMAHAEALPASLLLDLRQDHATTFVFDMVYAPVDTLLLQAAKGAGLQAVDGLVMLIGQARRAFASFYGIAPPGDRDPQLRDAIVARRV